MTVSTSDESAALTEKQRRIKEVREAIQTITDAHESWSLSDVEFFPQSLEMAISAGLNVVLNGDIPAELMALFAKCVALGDLWAKVLEGDEGLVSVDGMPTRPFWDALRDVQKLMEKQESIERNGIEPVADLLAAMKDNPHRHEQVARMYGKYDSNKDRWSGPFFLPGGSVDVRLIEKEAAEPGSVVPAGYNPLAERQQKQREDGISALEKVRRKLAEASGRPVDRDPATVEQLLREGQFPDVIASVKGVTEKHVRQLAASLGIAIKERDEILNDAFAGMIADDAERKNPKTDDFSGVAPSPVNLDLLETGMEIDLEDSNEADSDELSDFSVDEPDESLETKLTGEDLKAFVAVAFSENADVTVAQLSAMIEADGQTASPIAIGRALSNCRQTA